MVSVRVNNVAFHVTEFQQEEFWAAVRQGLWEPDTFEILDRFLEPSWRFVDIGAWIGPTSLYAAKKCGIVDAYECDPVALRALKDNFMLNRDILERVKIHEFALGDHDGSIELYSAQLGNSETSIFNMHERNDEVLQNQQKIIVGVRDVQAIFRENGYANCDRTLVKIDVEGSEFKILPRLADYIGNSRCVWYVSFHELNLNPSDFPKKPYRVAEMIRALAAMAKLNWFNVKGERLSMESVLAEIISGDWKYHQSLVFCSRDFF